MHSLMEPDPAARPRTLLGFNTNQSLHRNRAVPGHPESSLRVDAVRDRLRLSGRIHECEVVESFPSIDTGDLLQSHSFSHVSALEKSEGAEDKILDELASHYDSVFLTKDSYSVACEAVACVRHLAEQVVEGKAPNAFAVVRPPGHHADRASACGFCLFNNAAQAAEAALLAGADRILLVDLDVHHGQGTQRIFYEDKRVLYFSLHRHECGGFWPHLAESGGDHIGDGPGRGYTVNVPLNETGCGDADYLLAVCSLLLPIAKEYDPQMIIVSAGFDCLSGDPVGGMAVSPDGYSHIIHHLKSLAGGKMLCVLEGGYNHSMSAAGVERCVRVLIGHVPYPLDHHTSPPRKSTVESILSTTAFLRAASVWQCLEFYAVRAGSRALGWHTHVPCAAFSSPTGDDRPPDTQNVEQRQLAAWQGKRGAVFTRRTLVVFDECSEKHAHKENAHHPECPHRIRGIRARLSASSLWGRCDVLENVRVASEGELTAVHSKQHVDMMRSTQTMCVDELARAEARLNSIYLTPHSYQAAARASGAVLQCVDRVLSSPAGEWNAFAVVRPPGHHAGVSAPSGFCIFNNVAVAAKYAQSRHGVRRVLIVDWDVHHGNGTQEVFYQDPSVLFVSLHRSDGGGFYPLGEPKEERDCGEGEGVGRTVNVPWSYARMGDAEYRAALLRLILPICYEFAPDMVLLSAGFDAAAGDPLGEYHLSPPLFAEMTHHLLALAGGRLVAVLEGGYNVDAIARCTEAVLEVMVDRAVKIQPKEFPEKSPVCSEGWTCLRRVAQAQQTHWKWLAGMQVDGEHAFDHDFCDWYSSSSSEEEEGEEMSEQPGASKQAEMEQQISEDAALAAEIAADNGMHAVVPLTSCPHLDKVSAVPSEGISALSACLGCGTEQENWVCLQCYKPHCGRFVCEHALMHHLETEHPMALSLADLSVWCYPCESYVHNEALLPAKQSAHRSKFGVSMGE